MPDAVKMTYDDINVSAFIADDGIKLQLLNDLQQIIDNRT